MKKTIKIGDIFSRTGFASDGHRVQFNGAVTWECLVVKPPFILAKLDKIGGSHDSTTHHPQRFVFNTTVDTLVKR